MRVSLIVAMADNRVIGQDGQLPWRLSADLQRFKRLTMGHHLIMGRKTFESIGRLLPGRTTIVLTRQQGYASPGALVADGLQQALGLAGDDDEVFIVGGAEIYRSAWKLIDRIYLTRVHARLQGDVHFPMFDESAWQVANQSEHPADERNEYDSTFQQLEKR